jgi:hypothetical protein
MADVIVEEPQSQADAAEPAVPGEGKRCDPLDMDGYGNQQCMPARTFYVKKQAFFIEALFA